MPGGLFSVYSGRAEALADFLGVCEGALSVEEVLEGKEERGVAYCDAVVIVQDGFLVDFFAVD